MNNQSYWKFVYNELSEFFNALEGKMKPFWIIFGIFLLWISLYDPTFLFPFIYIVFVIGMKIFVTYKESQIPEEFEVDMEIAMTPEELRYKFLQELQESFDKIIHHLATCPDYEVLRINNALKGIKQKHEQK